MISIRVTQPALNETRSRIFVRMGADDGLKHLRSVLRDDHISYYARPEPGTDTVLPVAVDGTLWCGVMIIVVSFAGLAGCLSCLHTGLSLTGW